MMNDENILPWHIFSFLFFHLNFSTSYLPRGKKGQPGKTQVFHQPIENDTEL